MIIIVTPVKIACIGGLSTKNIKDIFYIAASENNHQTGLLAGIAVLTIITLLAVTLLFAMCVYVRCSHRQLSGLYTVSTALN